MSWFESWFDSPYYHLLYQHRNEDDARAFLDHLVEYLKPPPGSSILDLGCGKGRHSLYLNRKGYTVTGIDLSEQSIRHCLQYENDTLSFFVHDMRHLFRVNDFDFVLNLFTSLGYFDNRSENNTVIRNAGLALKRNGVLVIDYLNSNYVKENLVEQENIVVEQVNFNITRSFTDGFFVKNIKFDDRGEKFNFTEKVAAFSLDDFRTFIMSNNMSLVTLFGNYDLQPFDEQHSPRLIIVARKN
jgi:SAM-dependent methyltransferase